MKEVAFFERAFTKLYRCKVNTFEFTIVELTSREGRFFKPPAKIAAYKSLIPKIQTFPIRSRLNDNLCFLES